MKNIESKPELLLAPRDADLILPLKLKQIKRGDFLERMRDFDQAVPFHVGDEKLLKRMKSVEREFQNTPDAFEYYNLRSLMEFHLGQTAGFEERIEQALQFFETSLISAQLALKSDPEDDDYRDEWVEYIRGTIAYFKRSLSELRQAEEKVKGGNHEVLKRLRIGLETNNTVDYHRDY